MRRALGAYRAGALFVVGMAALALVLSACGGSSSSSSSTTSTSQGTTTSSTSTTSTTSSNSGGTAATPACTTSGLTVRLDTNGNGAAGSVYYALNFTNRSGHPCTLGGYPGVSGVSAAGTQLGSAAARNATSSPKTVILANGATATSTLQVTDVGNFPSATCRPTSAAGLRVYVPNQTAWTAIAFAFQACAKAGPVYLLVTPVT
jgi:hypothetical protein